MWIGYRPTFTLMGLGIQYYTYNNEISLVHLASIIAAWMQFPHRRAYHSRSNSILVVVQYEIGNRLEKIQYYLYHLQVSLPHPLLMSLQEIIVLLHCQRHLGSNLPAFPVRRYYLMRCEAVVPIPSTIPIWIFARLSQYLTFSALPIGIMAFCDAQHKFWMAHLLNIHSRIVITYFRKGTCGSGISPHITGLRACSSSGIGWHAALIAALQDTARGILVLKRFIPMPIIVPTMRHPRIIAKTIAIGEYPHVIWRYLG